MWDKCSSKLYLHASPNTGEMLMGNDFKIVMILRQDVNRTLKELKPCETLDPDEISYELQKREESRVRPPEK